MSKYVAKHGDIVSFKNDDGVEGVGKIIIEDSEMYMLSNDPEMDGSDAKNKHGYKFSWSIDQDDIDDGAYSIKLSDGFQEGSILTLDGESFKVLVRINDCILLSEGEDFEETKTWFTIAELKAAGYKSKQDDSVIELTLEDIAKMKGVDVTRIKIKK